MAQFHSSIFIVTASFFVSSTCLDIHQPEYAQAAPLYGYGQRAPYGHQYQPGIYHQESGWDESYHSPVNYRHAQSQQNYGQIVRRSSPPLAIRRTPCPQAQQQQNVYRCYRSIPTPSVPLYPVCNIHDRPSANFNEGTRLNPLPGRDSRNALDLSGTQYIGDITRQSPIISPKYSSNPPIKLDDTIDERTTQKHQSVSFHERLNRTKNSSDSNEAEEDSSRTSAEFGQFNNTNILVNSVRSAESNGGKVHNPTDGRTYSTYIGPQRPLKNPPAASVDKSTYPDQPPTYTFGQELISSTEANAANSPHSLYKYFNRMQPADSLSSLLKSSSSTNNKKQYPIYIPNVPQKNSSKDP